MNLQDFIEQLSHEHLKELAKALNARALFTRAHELNLKLTEEDAAEVYAALYPVRDGNVDDDTMELVFGGIPPTPSAKVLWTVKPTSRL